MKIKKNCYAGLLGAMACRELCRFSPHSLLFHILKILYTVNLDPIMQQLYEAYEREKKVSNSYDFDDLLLEVLNLFKTQSIFKQQFQERVRHVLVDEYQDTNQVQHALLKEMALKKTDKVYEYILDSLCVVGDEDQSIYSWRGATIANILNFKKDFDTTQLITIDQNYRSVQSILDIANAVIKHNMQRNKNYGQIVKGPIVFAFLHAVLGIKKENW